MLSGSCGPGVAGAGAGAGVLVDRPGSVGAWGGWEKARRLGWGVSVGGCFLWLFLWLFFVSVPVPRHPPPSVPSVPPSRVFVFVYSDIGFFK